MYEGICKAMLDKANNQTIALNTDIKNKVSFREQKTHFQVQGNTIDWAWNFYFTLITFILLHISTAFHDPDCGVDSDNLFLIRDSDAAC